MSEPEGRGAAWSDEPARAGRRDAAPRGLTDGVYAALPGPHYETPAEIAMLRTLGADLVGMSTALEAIAARHLGAEVLAISLVTNLAAGLSAHGLDHGEVGDQGDGQHLRAQMARSEERRVGKECRSRWSPYH